MKKNMTKLLVTIAVLIGGTGFLIYSSINDAEYYKMVEEVMAEPDRYEGKTMRIHGYVEAGSIDEKIVNQQTKRTFVLEHKGQSIHVKHEGPAPDTFKDLSEVVANGRLVKNGTGEYVLEATELMAKCPSKYEGAGANKNLGKERTVF